MIHVLGVFATKHINKGEVIAVLGGVIVQKKDRKQYEKEIGDVGIQIHDDFFICPTSTKELKCSGVFNHSCNPNIGYINSVSLVAIKNIIPGEELVFDYAFSESIAYNFRCRCASLKCRKNIRSSDWKIKSIQNKYLRYFSPYLKNKI